MICELQSVYVRVLVHLQTCVKVLGAILSELIKCG